MLGPESALTEEMKRGVFIYVAGKDFTQSVFPDGYVDFSYSCMAAATLDHFPSKLENVYFFASDEVMATEEGKAWVEAYRKFLAKFMAARERELRQGGIFLMVTSSYSVDPDIQ